VSLIIDTCNVLHRTGILPPDLAGIDEHGLVKLLLTSRYRNRESLLICDGGPSEARISREHPHVRYVFGRPEQTADDLIMDFIERSSAPKRLLVVTSDRRIAATARRRRCRILDSDTFLEQLAQDAQGRESFSRNTAHPASEDHAVEAWIKRFGLDEDLTTIPLSERPTPPPPPAEDSSSPPAASSESPPPPPRDEWETMDTEELLRRYERGQDADLDET
jgi:hypothetical protein